LISVSLAPASYLFSAARTYGAGKVDAATAASAAALKSRRDGFFVIVASLPGARIVLASHHASQAGSRRLAAQ